MATLIIEARIYLSEFLDQREILSNVEVEYHSKAIIDLNDFFKRNFRFIDL